MVLNLDRLGVQALWTAMIAQFVASAMSHAVSTVAPEITHSLHFNASFMGFYTACVYTGACISALIGGNFIQKYGPARILQFSLIAYAIAMLLCVSDWALLIIGSGLLLGLGKGLLQPANNTMVSHHADKRHLDFIFSLKQLSGPLGVFVAGIVIPFLAVHYDWQVALTFAATLGAIGAVWCWTVRNDQDTYTKPKEKINPKTLQESFRLVMGDKVLFRLAVLCICYKGLSATVLAYLVTFLVHRELSLQFAGFVLAFSTVGIFFGRLFWGWFADQIHSSRAVLSLCGVIMGVMTILLSQVGVTSSHAYILGIVFMLSFCAKGWSGVYYAQIAINAPGGKVSEATGGADFLMYMGAIFVPVIFGLLVTHLDTNYHFVFYLMGAATIITGILVMFLEGKSSSGMSGVSSLHHAAQTKELL